jgi:hypothetical protein
MATADNALLLAMRGPRNPYGKIGIIETGAMADLILVDGDPLENIELISDSAKNFVVINERRAGFQEYAEKRSASRHLTNLAGANGTHFKSELRSGRCDVWAAVIREYSCRWCRLSQ